jgi:2-dehydro-3-deoxygalactonokinase
MTHWIAVDWGTTRLRATRMDGARATRTRESGDGMAGLTGAAFEAALLALTDDWLIGPTRVIACGMVGARQGWIEAPYRAVPCAPLAGDLLQAPVEDSRLDVRIVPGLSQVTPHPDVMRGEETQIAGLLRLDAAFDGVACLPGTHTKWAHLSAGEAVGFITAATGELFSAICDHTVLRHSLAGDGWSEAPFLDAVSDALSRPETVITRLFQIRAADLLQGQDATMARSILSGLLIGAELAATRPWWLGRDVALIGSDRTTPAYAAALRAQGAAPRLLSARDATLAGLTQARDMT